MPDILAANVTYTELPGRRYLAGLPPRYQNQVQLVFGDNTLTYPTGGIQLTASKMGCPAGVVEEVRVIDQGSNATGYKFEWIQATNKLKATIEDTVATNTPLKEHTNATFVPNPATVIIEAVGY